MSVLEILSEADVNFFERFVHHLFINQKKISNSHFLPFCTSHE
jgi:hypothetical protein